MTVESREIAGPVCPHSPTQAHHYMIESLGGGAEVGICRHCGGTKTFAQSRVDGALRFSTTRYPCPHCGNQTKVYRDPMVGYYRECRACTYRELM